MQTALHITTLVAELKEEIIGGRIISSEVHRKLRSAFLFIKHKKSLMVLGFSYHPDSSGSYLIPASKLRLDSKEKPRPLFEIKSGIVEDIHQLGLDRIFEIVIVREKQKHSLVFEVLGPNGNIWLLDSNRMRIGSLRKREFVVGEQFQLSDTKGGDRLNLFDFDMGEAVSRLTRESEQSLVSKLKTNFTGINNSLARELIKRSSLDCFNPVPLTEDQAVSVIKSGVDIALRFKCQSIGYLYQMHSGWEAYPFKLSIAQSQPEKYKNISLAIMSLLSRKKISVSKVDKEKQFIKAVDKKITHLKKLQDNLINDIEFAADFENQKRIAELLQLNRNHLKKGMTKITVTDILNDKNCEITIKLDPSLSVTENIDHYFKKHRKGREGLKLLERRQEITGNQLSEMQRLKSDLEFDFETTSQRYEAEINALLPVLSVRGKVVQRLPYREATLSTGLTIYVGRDGADNDRTTFEFARPYELWFHTQQCPGSHVVMKFPTKEFEPSKSEIEETASIAAFHSKARHDSLVPVIYTLRKYVRKPRKAKPGLVTVEREKSVMVPPKPIDF